MTPKYASPNLPTWPLYTPDRLELQVQAVEILPTRSNEARQLVDGRCRVAVDAEDVGGARAAFQSPQRQDVAELPFHIVVGGEAPNPHRIK